MITACAVRCSVPEPPPDQCVHSPLISANIVVGLCVGHDSVFYKHSDAIVTTIVTKDRVTGHNPVAPLYTANSYSKSIYGPERK